MVTGSRDSTTVAPQALYLLNDPFVRQQAAALSDHLLRDQRDDAGRIRAAYRLTLGRAATAAETERAVRYLVDYAANVSNASRAGEEAWASFCQALLASAEFRYIR